MKRKLLVAVVAAFTAMCLMLVGCGGNATKENYDNNFKGSWTIIAMSVDNGESVSESDMALMRSYGYKATLEMKEDKTFTISIADQDDITGKWEAKSATEVAMTVNNETAVATLSDDTLVLDADGASMTFKRSDKVDQATSSSAAASSASQASSNSAIATGDKASADVSRVYENDFCSIQVTRKAIDVSGDPSVYFIAKNKTDKTLYLNLVNDGSINGKEYDARMSTTLESNQEQTSEDFMWFSEHSDVNTLDEFKNIEFVVQVSDDSSLDKLGTITIKIA